MNETPDRGPRHEDDPVVMPSDERDEPTHEEREEWIKDRDEEFKKSVTDELIDYVIPDMVLFRHQAD